MSEQTIAPCPNCTGTGVQNDYLISTGHIACEDWAIELPVEVWDKLSDAAELARACEVLSANTVHISANLIGGEIQPLVWFVQSQHGKAHAEHLPDALIALAEQVQE